jgi:hypothetical protein
VLGPNGGGIAVFLTATVRSEITLFSLKSDIRAPDF